MVVLARGASAAAAGAAMDERERGNSKTLRLQCCTAAPLSFRLLAPVPFRSFPSATVLLPGVRAASSPACAFHRGSRLPERESGTGFHGQREKVERESSARMNTAKRSKRKQKGGAVLDS